MRDIEMYNKFKFKLKFKFKFKTRVKKSEKKNLIIINAKSAKFKTII